MGRKKSRKKKGRKKSSLKNPACRPSRYKRYKYLGKKVKDVGACGLDRPSEYYGIIRAIMRDYKNGEISKATARGRLLLLYRLTYPSKNSKARSIPPAERERIRERIIKAMEKL